ncbi:hypothetical protein EP7_004509 [Isosphaeraceae bacterium EP7]
MVSGRPEQLRRNWITSRGLLRVGLWVGLLGALVMTVGLPWFIFNTVLPHQRASLVLTVSGTQPIWTIDSTNWTLGGETEVRVSPIDPFLGDPEGPPFSQLTSLHRVTSLNLNSVHTLRDSDLRFLNSLNVLRSIRIDRAINANEIWGPKLTDLGLADICRRKSLIEISLVNQRAMTDSGLVAFPGLKQLESLDLSGTKIGDAGLPHLGRCVSIRRLALKNTEITDAGLAHLRGLRSLESLDVEGTRVTKAGVDSFVSALPNSIFVGYGKGPSPRPRTEFQEAYR